MEIIKQVIRYLVCLPKTKRKDSISMKYIKWYAVLFSLCINIYLIMTFYKWYKQGIPDVAEFRQFITVLSGTTVIVGFISKWLVDINKDGVPDIINNEEKKGNNNNNDT